MVGCQDCGALRREVAEMKASLKLLFQLNENMDKKFDDFVALFRSHFSLQTEEDYRHSLDAMNDPPFPQTVLDNAIQSSTIRLYCPNSEQPAIKIEPCDELFMVEEPKTYFGAKKDNCVEENCNENLNLSMQQDYDAFGADGCVADRSDDASQDTTLSELLAEHRTLCQDAPSTSSATEKNFDVPKRSNSKKRSAFLSTSISSEFAGGETHIAVQDADGQKRRKCRLCNKTYKSISHVRRHIREVHEGRRFPCELCGAEFVRLHLLITHQERKHQVV